MDHAFAPAGLHALVRFARSRALLALDFDGTLAPIVDDGDDDTDEDVFALCRADRLLGIRVRPRSGSAAACCIRTQREVDTLLRRQVELRRGRPETREDGATADA